MRSRTSLRGVAAMAGGAAAVLASAALALAPAAPPADPPLTLVEARRLIRMMNDIYVAGVFKTHSMYVHDPGTPAAVTWAKQVIREVRGKGWPEARIFAATDRPLNPENAVEGDFERRALAAFRAGKPDLERANGGMLYYSVPIRIQDQSCLTCHVRARPGELAGGVSYRIRFGKPGR